MEEQILQINELSFQAAQVMWPWFLAMTSIVIVLMVKDFATKLVKGLEFKLSSAFDEGDKVLLEGEHALIIKIGITTTVFGMQRKEGLVWR